MAKARSVAGRGRRVFADLVDRRRAPAPVAALSLSGLTNPAAYRDERWLQLHNDLGTYSYETHIFGSTVPPNIYRKGWEWAQAAYGLERLGMLQPHFSAIGVGAGRECLIFWLGDRLKKVVATDLYGNDAWSNAGGREADAAVVENPAAFSPRPIREDVIEFRVMDGTDLSAYADDTFDIAWSLSSIEHFGGHARSADAVREMARVVKPGGIVVIATEYVLLEDQEHPEYFNRSMIERYVIGASPRLKLVEPIDWSLPPVEYLIDSVTLPLGVDRLRRHVVLNDGARQWTSWIAFFRKQ
jgi:SAM-dependent methyltransferase